MFARLLWRLLRGSGGRLAVALVAIVSGAAVVSALLNLQFDIERKLTQEFRALGPNVLIAANVSTSPGATDAPASAPQLLEQSQVTSAMERTKTADLAGAVPFLYVVAQANGTPVVAAGTNLADADRLNPSWKITGDISSLSSTQCLTGRNAAQNLQLAPGRIIEMKYLDRSASCTVAAVLESGGAEDNQIFLDLSAVQTFAGTPGKIQFEQLRVSGSAADVSAYASRLASALPAASVAPIRQVTDAEGNLLRRTRLLIASTVGLILVLTALCVLATMAALAMERREDVGLMKALGGSIGRIVSLFLAELGVLGATGGAVGCLAGYTLARWIGERMFETAVSPRWEIFPLTVALMTVVALAGALPLQRLGSVKPAVILRGE